jgi:hypothetical protein
MPVSDILLPQKNKLTRIFSTIGFRLSLASVCAFAFVSLGVIWIVFSFARYEALREAEEKALVILNRNLASHQYFNREMKPRLFSFAAPILQPDYFDPFWMSSTFAVRSINRIYNDLSGKDGYYYKECAISARSPLNEADEFEKSFILELNKDPQLTVRSGVRDIEGQPFFYVLRRGESMEDNCMRCHSTPDKAPGSMVSQYGPTQSFHRKIGDVVSALSIRIPLKQAYIEANKLALRLSLIVVITFASMFLFLYILLQRYIFIPLSIMRKKTAEIIENDHNLGSEMPVAYGVELNELATTFNTMSHKLKDQVDTLEDRVKERTAELEEALSNVKTLSGMLPICASCKKIRDDKGYWTQVETYISKHSETVFSHGICPDCAKKAYEEIDRLKKKNKP